MPERIKSLPKSQQVRRRCRHNTGFTLVERFVGCEVWQCDRCGKTATVITRPEGQKTCLVCGKELTGRKYRWCGSECEEFYAAHLSRDLWARYIRRRDGNRCQHCGWKPTRESWRAFRTVYHKLSSKHPDWSPMKLYHEAMRMTGFRMLEAHHVVPLEEGGPELNPANGILLCHICHDEEHRRLKQQKGGGGCRRKREHSCSN